MKRKFSEISNRPIVAVLLLLMVFGFGGKALAQNRTVTGMVVSSADNQPLIGAGVVIAGTSAGTSTDINGKFSLSVPNGRNMLQVSYLGYVTKEVVIGGGSELLIALDEDNTFFDEVIVVGYGVQKKKLNTGANLQVKSDELMKKNATTALQALQGLTPGMQISSNSGQPGGSMKVTIRGMGTIDSSSPLYIVDGIPGDISKINPADIESIDVMKDAASAAIYGAQAANGVVIVTTKTGRKNSSQVYYDGYAGVQSVYRKAPLLNAEQYRMIMDEEALNSGGTVFDWSKYDMADTNWMDYMFRPSAPMQNHTVGVSGGSDTSVYAISFNYTNQEGIIGTKDNSFRSDYKIRLNSEHTIYKDLLKIGEHLTFVQGKSASVSDGNQYWNTLRGAFQTSPLAHVYGYNYYGWGDEKGMWNDSAYEGEGGHQNQWYLNDGNPYASMLIGRSLSKSQNLIGDIYAELTPLKGLTIRSTFGLSFYASRGHSIGFNSRWNSYGTIPGTDADYDASVSQNMSNGYSISWINTAQYDFTIADDHNLSVMVGSEYDTNEGEYVNGSNKITVAQFKDFEHAWLQNGSSDNSKWSQPGGGVNDIDITMSAFTRLGYNYKEKYMVNATLRADGSSKFAKGNRWGFFPSVSAGWVMTSEDFMSDVSWLNFLKLRASWGQVGNKNIGNYRYTAPIGTSGYNYAFGGGLNPDSGIGSSAEQQGALQTRLANKDIKWETSEQLDFGFDARLFASRLDMNFDVYRKTTRDWLVTAPIIATAGSGAPYINGGDVTNTGVELALNWHGTIGRDFYYYVGANGAYNKNVVGNIPNTDGIIHGSSNQLFDNTDEFYRAENGHAIGYWWGYETAGIFQNQKQIDDWRAAGNGVLQANVQPGDVIFVDQNHDGAIDDNDKIDLGSGIPDFTYGFSLGFDWKGLDFSLSAFGVAGVDIVQSYRNHVTWQSNWTTAVLNRWTGEGTSNRIPRVTQDRGNWDKFSDLFLQSGDYLRISNITLGYDFSKIAKQSWLGQLRLYCSVQNAFTFTKYDGMDPEIGYGTDGWVSGIDVGFYPHPRTFLIGLNIKL